MRLMKYLSVMLAGLASVQASSIEFTLEEGKPLSVVAAGITKPETNTDGDVVRESSSWSARPATDADEEFLRTQIFGSADVMYFFGNRQIRDEGHAKVRIGHANTRFGAGSPHGSMMVCDKTSTPIGWFIAGGGDEPGASEVALALIPQVWNKGYGASLMQFATETWAPAVRSIGLGLPCDAFKGSKENASKTFQCFGGKPLNRLDATTSPDNVFMQRALHASGFHAAQSRVTNLQEPFQLSTTETLEAQLSKLFEGENALKKESTRYQARLNNHRITFSWSSTYGCIKLHYEYNVQLKEEAGYSNY